MAFDFGAEFFEGKFGVVAGAGGLGDGGDAIGEKAGEEHGGFDLGYFFRMINSRLRTCSSES